MTDTEYKVLSDGRRLDVLLSEETGLSRSRVASLMEDGLCVSGGKEIRKAGTKVPEGQEIVLTVPAPREAIPQAEDIPIEILYEDEYLAVVNKPAGLVVHPGAGNPDGTLVNALMGRLSSLSGIGGELRPGIVHRLDKDTSGLILIAKDDETHQALSAQLANREMEKHYRAVVEGRFREDAGRVEAPIGRSAKDRKKMAIRPDGRYALTEWKVLRPDFRHGTLLDVHILTGRTHQIRVHLKSVGHPVCGDELYGNQRGVKVPCLMLHAYSLSFEHPRTKEKMIFQAPLPDDFYEGIKKQRNTHKWITLCLIILK